MSKGDWRRPALVERESYDKNFEAAFGPQEEPVERRKVRGVTGGAVIPYERLDDEVVDGLYIGRRIYWLAMPATVVAFDPDEREVEVRWADDE